MNDKTIFKLDKKILDSWYLRLMNIDVKGHNVVIMSSIIQELEQIMSGDIYKENGDENGNKYNT